MFRKLFVTLLFICSTIIFAQTADAACAKPCPFANCTRSYNVKTGGGTGALDAYDGDCIKDGDVAIITTKDDGTASARQREQYTADADCTTPTDECTADGDVIIAPLTNPGNIRWKKTTPGTIPGDLTVTGDFSANGVSAYPTNSLHTRRSYDEIFLELFQSSHGWTGNANCSVADDTSDYILGTQSIKVTSTGGLCIVGSTTIPSTDLTNNYIKIYFKASDFSNIVSSSFVVNVSSDGFTSNTDYAFANAAVENVAGDKDGKWFTAIVPFSASAVPGATMSAITDVRVYVAGMTSGTTLNINAISTIPEMTSGIVSIAFDDGNNTDVKAAKYMAKYGYVGTSFVTTLYQNNPLTNGGQTLTALTVTEMQNLQKWFLWNISGHSKSHADEGTYLINMTASELTKDILDNKNWLLSNGLVIGSEIFAYPGGGVTEAMKDTVKKYYKLARAFYTNAVNETIPINDYYEVRTFLVTASTAFSSITNAIDNAITNKEYLIISFHRTPDNTECAARQATGDCPKESYYEYCFDSTCATNYAAAADRYFQNVIDYLNTNNVTVLPISDVVELMPNRP